MKVKTRDHDIAVMILRYNTLAERESHVVKEIMISYTLNYGIKDSFFKEFVAITKKYKDK